jgi:hypothetical protein
LNSLSSPDWLQTLYLLAFASRVLRLQMCTTTSGLLEWKSFFIFIFWCYWCLFELRALDLLGKHSPTWATWPQLFLLLVIFPTRISCFCLDSLDWNPSVYTSWVAGVTGMHYHA